MFIQWLYRLFKRPNEPIDETLYADYICALPTNWIPQDDGIKMDINFTWEQNELQNYADSVRNFKTNAPESLLKNTPEKISFMREDEE